MKEVKVLGTGCQKCKTLAELTTKAVTELGIEAEIIKVEDIAQIMQHGVMMTPALMIDKKLVLSGRIPSMDELKKMLQA